MSYICIIKINSTAVYNKENLILETFLKLTNQTCPYGYEDDLVQLMIEQGIFPTDLQKDIHGNYFYKIGESRTIFASHLDTVSKDYVQVVHTFDDYLIGTDGKTTLGADDKAGMTVILYMIENKVPGLYYFFIGEEVGCIGSSAASTLDFSDYKKCVSFDRRGYDSVITEQLYGVCCSDEFASALSQELNKKNLTFNFRPDPTGIFTDSACFMDSIPECTNISVGYFNEHKHNETQDIKFLVNLCEAVVKIDWTSDNTLDIGKGGDWAELGVVTKNGLKTFLINNFYQKYLFFLLTLRYEIF